MTRRVVAVLRTARFKEIVETMARWQVSAMPVVDAERRVVGVVSEADLLLKEESQGLASMGSGRTRHPADLAKAGASTAQELTSSPALTAHEDLTLAQAARLMAVERMMRLPAIDAEVRIRGVVS